MRPPKARRIVFAVYEGVSLLERRADARYSRDHWPKFAGAGNFNISGRSSRIFWLVGYVRRSRPSGIKRYNKEKARVEPDRAGSDCRFGTDGSFPG